MSDPRELEDDVEADEGLQAELFGDSDSDDEAPQAPAVEPEPAERAPQSAKARLEELAQRKRKQAEQEEAEREQQKRQRRQAAPEEEEEEDAAEEEPAAGGSGAAAAAEPDDAVAAVFGDDEDDEEEEANEQATAADQAFIDDAGVEEEEGGQIGSDSDDGGGAQQPPPDEAELEEDEFEAMFKGAKSRRRRRLGDEDVKASVDQLLAHMEVAAEKDMEANKQGQPAVMKLKMLTEVEDRLSRRTWHDELLASGILGVLKAWIEPMPDGNLPNIKIRSAVLRMLALLPVDVADGLRKEQLKKSGLGKVVMFLYKLPDESLENRRAAKELVERWSRPIFDAYRERRVEEDVREREAQMRQARAARQAAAEQQQAADAADNPAKALKPGDHGFRWHASIPQPARLDYLKRPESKVAADAVAQKRAGSKMDRKLKVLNKKATNAGAKAAKVSIEGRGLLI